MRWPDGGGCRRHSGPCPPPPVYWTGAGSTRVSPATRRPPPRGTGPAAWSRTTSPGWTRPTSRPGGNGRGAPGPPGPPSPAGSTGWPTGPPLARYAVAAARVLRRACRRVELHHLPTRTVHAWEHTPATLDRHVGRAEDIAAECADADQRYRDGLPPGRLDEVFPPSPGPGCGWCDFRAVCPEGAAAASARRPWDGLEELSGN